MNYRDASDVNLIQHCGGDHMVVAAAKVSTDGDEALRYALETFATDNYSLINYLMKHRHGTPFEHALMTYFVRTPIFVWREWMRHRIGFSYNEESGRYKQLEPLFYLPNRERPMIKVDNWKAGRPKFVRCESDEVYNSLVAGLIDSYETGYRSYEIALGNGVDPGLARDSLPVGIFSSAWVSCNPRSMMHYLSLRVHEPDATFVSYPLWEIDQVARTLETMFALLFPLTHKAFIANGRVAP